MFAEITTQLNYLLDSTLFIYILLFIYSAGAFFITIYSIGLYHLLFIYLFNRKKYKRVAPQYEDEDWPYVTVQIPMYNELYVAEHVIDSCASIDYPKDRFEIQVLDDSTDETINIVNSRAKFWKSKGIDIQVVHRENRKGFKAGALAYAIPLAKGEFIAIFDADFRPNADFLKRTIGFFQDSKVAVVQARWGHLNRNYSLLTRAQSLLHDAFFMIEQQARDMASYFLRFNGSAGIWRKQAITDAGGWSHETLSEDYDLCLRAQLKGWKFIYDHDTVAPAELPVTMSDFKAQQYRWTKGRGQMIKKFLGQLITAKVRPMVKIHAIFDILNVFVLVGILFLGVSSIPIAFLIVSNALVQKVMIYLTVSLINVVLVPWFAWIVMGFYSHSIWTRIMEMIKTFIPFIITMIAAPLFLTVALVDGFFNNYSFFHRTSKYNALDKKVTWKDKLYKPSEISPITWFEGFLALWFVLGIWVDFKTQIYGFLPSHFFLTIGYSFLFMKSFRKA